MRSRNTYRIERGRLVHTRVLLSVGGEQNERNRGPACAREQHVFLFLTSAIPSAEECKPRRG